MRLTKREKESENAEESARRAKRHAMIMRGVVTPIFGLLAVAAIALGLLNATVWQPSRTITADAKVTGTRYIVTDPDVMGLVDDHVTITADGGSGTVCVAVASSKDATGWLAGNSYVRLTGLSDWTTLSTEKASAGKSSGSASDGSADGEVSFADSDMWRSVKCGDGSVEIKATASAVTDVALVDLGKDGASADVSFTWTRATLPDYATPMYFIGGLLAVLAVLTASVFAMPPHKRRKRIVESDPVRTNDEEVSIAEAFTGSINAIRPSFTPRDGRPRRRHAVGSDTSTIPVIRIEGEPEPSSGAQPVVVDPSSRNLVADAAQSGAGAQPGMQSDASSNAPQSVQSNANVPAPLFPDALAPSVQAEEKAAIEESATSVISQDELQAYFARLAQEVGDGSADSGGTDPDGADDGKQGGNR